MRTIYLLYSFPVVKDDVQLFHVECDLLIHYSLDAAAEPIPELEWHVAEFHFEGAGPLPKQMIYTRVTKTEPLFGVLYDATMTQVARDEIEDRLWEALDDQL